MLTSPDSEHTLAHASGLSRRTLVMGAVWSTPVILFAVSSPAAASTIGIRLVSLVDLGPALLLTVLAGDAVTDNLGSVITGKLGANAGAALTDISAGTQLATPDEVTAAITAFDAAYADAMARTATEELIGELGGLTLTPGTYHSTAAVGLTGVLTLDALGDPNAVFIIQVPEAAITTAASSSVVLVGGADPARIFWVTGFAVTLGASSNFSGNVLAQAAATLGAGAIVFGRILARAAVTLDANTITAPA